MGFICLEQPPEWSTGQLEPRGRLWKPEDGVGQGGWDRDMVCAGAMGHAKQHGVDVSGEVHSQ